MGASWVAFSSRMSILCSPIHRSLAAPTHITNPMPCYVHFLLLFDEFHETPPGATKDACHRIPAILNRANGSEGMQKRKKQANGSRGVQKGKECLFFAFLPPSRAVCLLFVFLHTFQTEQTARKVSKNRHYAMLCDASSYPPLLGGPDAYYKPYVQSVTFRFTVLR